MLLNNSSEVLSKQISSLLGSRPERSRMDHAKAMGVADGTLGRIKYGTGNPTIEVLDQIANYFKIKTWQLLAPADESTGVASQELSGEHLMIAADAADEALRGLHVSKPNYWEIVAIAHDCIVDGMPYADVLNLLRPIATDTAKQGAKHVSVTRESLAPAPVAGRRQAQGNR